MKKTNKNEKGITIVSVVVLVIVAAIILAIALAIVSKQDTTGNTNETADKVTNQTTNEIQNETGNTEEKEEEEKPIIVPIDHVHKYETVAKETEATCTEQGKKYIECSCGSQIIEVTSQSKGHVWKNGNITKMPTETEEGEMTYTCENCDEVRIEKISK